MPKNKLFKSQNYTSKNHSFKHFIFQNAFQFHFEISGQKFQFQS